MPGVCEAVKLVAFLLSTWAKMFSNSSVNAKTSEVMFMLAAWKVGGIEMNVSREVS